MELGDSLSHTNLQQFCSCIHISVIDNDVNLPLNFVKSGLPNATTFQGLKIC